MVIALLWADSTISIANNMYIWTGACVDRELDAVRTEVREIDGMLGFQSKNSGIPLHITLKNAFYASDDAIDDILSDIAEYCAHLEPLELDVRGYECFDNICWIRYDMSDKAALAQNNLNDMLYAKYGVDISEYDSDGKLHTSLFFDPENEKVRRAYEMIRNVSLPHKVNVREFIICVSESGEFGTFNTVESVRV